MDISKEVKKPGKKTKRAAVKDKVVETDVLTKYLSEISKIKPLSREEETELACQIRNSNVRALHELVRRNLKYVVTVANKFKGCGLSLQDLIEDGNIGLIQAAKRFDGARNVKFITYAVWWIRQAIMHSLAEQSGTVRLPIKQVGKLYKFGRKYKSLAQVLEREPTQSEVARDMGMQEEDLETIMRAYRTHVSLDTPLREGDDTPYIDLLENPNYIPYDDQIIQTALHQHIDKILKDLTPREEQILRMRFGFHGESKTLEEIGKEINLSRERVRQIEKRAKAKLRAKLKTFPEEN
ncbi:MAG: RNA polymerase sigma factor RpoD/SigA [Nitrospinae bacterium]|nr:RNA polymerase sigma factor RpoD/SigA [Nitrospinota bacterium]